MGKAQICAHHTASNPAAAYALTLENHFMSNTGDPVTMTECRHGGSVVDVGKSFKPSAGTQILRFAGDTSCSSNS
jgi:hypothetical protein